MRTLIAILAALAITPAAAAMTPDGFYEGAPIPAPVVDTLPPPTTDTECPSIPTADAPLAACPFDPDTYWKWQGDDQDAPLWTHCNYDTGDPNDPCPHSHVGDQTWFFRCGHGTDPDTAGTVGQEFGWPETDPLGQTDVTDLCGGTWESLSAP